MNKIKNYFFWKELPYGAQSFLRRMGLFLVLYIILAWTQPAVNRVLYQFSPTYSNKYLGYLIFPIVFLFVVLRWNKIKQIKYYTFSKKLFFWCLTASLAFLYAPIKIFEKSLVANQELFITIYFFISLFAFLFLFLAILNYTAIDFFSHEITFVVGVYIFYTLIQLAERNFWPYISRFIVYSLQSTVPFFFDGMQFSVEHYNIIYNGFNVDIGPSCAGFHSMATFSILFMLTLFLLKHKEQKIKYFRAVWAFLGGLFVLFFFNIFRIAVIIIIGGKISPKLAMDLFHEYLSAIFLIIIFLVYLNYIIPKLVEKRDISPKQ